MRRKILSKQVLAGAVSSLPLADVRQCGMLCDTLQTARVECSMHAHHTRSIYTHVCTHSHMCTHNTFIHVYTHSCTRLHTHKAHTYTRVHSHAYSHAGVPYTRTQSQAHVHMLTHMFTYSHVHTGHTHAHTHIEHESANGSLSPSRAVTSDECAGSNGTQPRGCSVPGDAASSAW